MGKKKQTETMNKKPMTWTKHPWKSDTRIRAFEVVVANEFDYQLRTFS